MHAGTTELEKVKMNETWKMGGDLSKAPKSIDKDGIAQEMEQVQQMLGQKAASSSSKEIWKSSWS